MTATVIRAKLYEDGRLIVVVTEITRLGFTATFQVYDTKNSPTYRMSLDSEEVFSSEVPANDKFDNYVEFNA